MHPAPSSARRLSGFVLLALVLGSSVLLPVRLVGQGAGSGVAAFNPTGAPESYTVPAGVTTLVIEVSGGAGGGARAWGGGGAPGGRGAYVKGTLAVQGGDVIQVNVG